MFYLTQHNPRTGRTLYATTSPQSHINDPHRIISWTGHRELALTFDSHHDAHQERLTRLVNGHYLLGYAMKVSR